MEEASVANKNDTQFDSSKYRLVESVTLSFSNSNEIILPLNGVTVVVGPNNSGKSLLLREVKREFYQDTNYKSSKIVKARTLKTKLEINPDQIKKSPWVRSVRPHPNSTDSSPIDVLQFQSFSGVSTNEHELLLRNISKSIDNYNSEEATPRTPQEVYILSQMGLLRLDGPTRFDMLKSVSRSDYDAVPVNIF
ncbi:MAG: hypothetical protein AAFW65_03650 [Pseudomonadota bacterium]